MKIGLRLHSTIKVVLLTSTFLTSNLTFADTLIVFDNSHLIATTSAKGIVGYFNTQHQVLNFSCSFFFKETDHKADSKVSINSFPLPKSSYANRNKDDDIPGQIFFTKGEWIIQTDDPHDGCGGAVGSFNKGPDDDHPTRYAIVKEMPVIGIRIVSRKTQLHDKNGSLIKERKGFLVSGDVVPAIEAVDGLTRVRYVHSASGKTTIAWVKTSDLTDPFAD